ncbi:uncharacterized protein EDB91DRAFT_1082897 [Suillus paluster]|uniref:uncharacterized protein n=1 Tax=Suillus paluster TaxID=48578 RepID=UPI001B87560F|nr:uncharacterized protein EDB91DRAFT_1082897 [Suillus paluster]KAG1738143.1 hypothetical protein EDB91DRAFT_1082897 [Suillus paluster]
MSSYSHFLGIEQTEKAMICWLQKQGRDTLPYSHFVTASVLFGWINSHDLIALLDSWNVDVPQVMPDNCDARDKCNAWLLTLQGNTLGDSDATQISFGSPHVEAIHFHEFLTVPNNQFLSLPCLLKTWVDNTTYCAYIIASLAESKPSCISNSFKTKECKSLAVLKSDIHILGLKKQRAQVEVDMLSEAIAHMSDSKHTDDGAVLTRTDHSSAAPTFSFPYTDVPVGWEYQIGGAGRGVPRAVILLLLLLAKRDGLMDQVSQHAQEIRMIGVHIMLIGFMHNAQDIRDEEEVESHDKEDKEEDCEQENGPEQQFGSSSESLLSEVHNMYDSDLELDYENETDTGAVSESDYDVASTLPYALTLMSPHLIYYLMHDYLTLSWARFSKDIQSHTLQIFKILAHPAPRMGDLIKLDAFSTPMPSHASPQTDNTNLKVIAHFHGGLDFSRGLVDINFTMWPLFKCLNIDNILIIYEVCHKLNRIIDSSTELQYHIELGLDCMVDGPMSTITVAECLEQLFTLCRVWTLFEWKKEVHVPMPGFCQAYKLVGGIFAKTSSSGGIHNYTGSQTFISTWLPSLSDPGRTLVQTNIGISMRDFAIDPSQDLIALVKTDDDQRPDYGFCHCPPVDFNPAATIHPA